MGHLNKFMLGLVKSYDMAAGMMKQMAGVGVKDRLKQLGSMDLFGAGPRFKTKQRSKRLTKKQRSKKKGKKKRRR